MLDEACRSDEALRQWSGMRCIEERHSLRRLLCRAGVQSRRAGTETLTSRTGPRSDRPTPRSAYEVTGHCSGAGGMGEVYRARDTNGWVARSRIKSSWPRVFASDPDRLRALRARSARAGRRSTIRTSARSTDSKTADGVPALVLELVEGAHAGRCASAHGPDSR